MVRVTASATCGGQLDEIANQRPDPRTVRLTAPGARSKTILLKCGQAYSEKP